ncbi:hypothetical protein RND81_06G243200 [Saponaria officinalis]|uniref:BAH domain-containing protein n=1 Tax=Saponaria officinalis TaxID=3572 RepID=A0AAW1KEL5_SAPOF
MGVFARDDRKNTITKETMVGIRVSDKIRRDFPDSITTSTISSPNNSLDHENPNKKMKLLHEIEPLNHQLHQQIRRDSSVCVDSVVDDVEEDGEDCNDDDDDDEDDESVNDAEPIGDVVRVSDDGGSKRNHFRAFRFDGNVFQLEDTVLVAPEEGKVKPSVAVIKDIFQVGSDSLMVCGRRFYRPEEAEKKEGGTWQTSDARELFYSSYLDELDAFNVMHKCVIHLVPVGKTLPDRKQQPGFIVQKFYDFGTKTIRNLTKRDCDL